MTLEDQTSFAEVDGEIAISTTAQGEWVVPQSVLLFQAEFVRDGQDLVLKDAGSMDARLLGYFSLQEGQDILSAEGALLRASVVEKLAGPMFPAQYAQAGGFNLADAIGQVETIEGTAFVQRTDGQSLELEVGAKVFQGDVVRTENGSTLGLTFADGTIFTLASGSRMVLDELIYDPQSADNSGVFNLVEGGFVFIAGQAAKTGGIEINTPAATMGIRGTTGKIDIQTINGVSTVTVSLNPDPDGGLGEILLFDLAGNLITTITGTETKWIITPPFADQPPLEVGRDDADVRDDAVLLSQAVAAFQSAVNRQLNGETFVELPEGEDEEATQQDAPVIEEEVIEDAPPPLPPPLDETGDGTGPGGDSGTGNPELDGSDEPIDQQETGPSDADDASLPPPSTGPTFADNGRGATEFTNVLVQSVEDTQLTSQLPVTSPSGAPVQVSLSRGAENGQVVLASDGTFTYTPDPNFEGTDSFEISGLDETGQVQNAQVTVIVDPVNDAPVARQRLISASSVEEGSGTNSGSGVATGTLAYDDVDEGATNGQWSIVASPENTTSFGTITIDANSGAWRYDLDQAATDTLTDGEVFEESFVATVTDSEGATDTSTLVITISGTNDSPVISAATDQIRAFISAGPGVPGSEEDPIDASNTVSGQLSYTDVDEGTVPATWSVLADSGNETAFGAISIDPATGLWTYSISDEEPVPLGNGETTVEVYNATVTDAQGAVAVQAISITITGTNSAPTIVFSLEDISATVVEDGFVAGGGAAGSARIALPETETFLFQSRRNVSDDPSASGTLSYVDADGQPGEAVWSVEVDNATLGSMTINAVTGQWRYFLDQEAADSLRQGDEAVETFIATVTDPFGGTASQVITITVQGANDAASMLNNPADLVGTVFEGGVATAAGQLNFVDPDAAPGEAASWTIAPDGGSRGEMVIDPVTGQWTYTLDPAAAENLAAGDPVIETFTATVTDSFGATANQTITMSLFGENDAPVFAAGTASIAKTEASILVDLTALGNDVDTGEDGSTLVYAIAAPALEGSATLSGGELTFSTDGDFDDLSEGQSRDVIVEITATDFAGASVLGTVTFTVTGSNTGPVITSDAAAAQGDVIEAGDSTAGTPQVSGTLTYSDVDASTPTSGVWSVSPAAGLYGTIAIDATSGDWTYTLDQAAADPLGQGDTALETFVATITDETGQQATQQIAVTVNGSNDGPTLTAASTSIDKSLASTTIDLSALADDLDDPTNTLTFAVDGVSSSDGTASITGDQLTFSTDGDFADLGPGASRSVDITVRVTDPDGASSTGLITVEVTGSNQDPNITSTTVAANGALDEEGVGVPANGAAADATGQLTYSDADERAAAPANWSVVPNQPGSLGTMQIDASTGAWSYFLDQTAADSLRDGTVVTEEFTATITDEFGGTDTQLMTITITGTNDAPVVNVGTSETSATVTASGAGSHSGTLAFADSDIVTTPAVWSIAPDTGVVPQYGTMSINAAGVWTYAVDLVAVNAVPAGVNPTEVYRATITDEFGASDSILVTMQINGTNAPPEITSPITEAEKEIVENGDESTAPKQITGQLTYSDPDEAAVGAVWSVAPVGVPSLGSMTIDASSGLWTYTLDNAASDSLEPGDVVTEEFLATVTDANGAQDTQTIQVDVRGTNDSPLLAAGALLANEDGPEVELNLAALVTDPDSTSFSYAIITPPAKGTAVLDSGVLKFDPNGEFASLNAGETEVVTVTVRVQDDLGATSAQVDVTVTVTGGSDTPVMIDGTLAAIEDGPVATLDLDPLGSDADGDPLTYAISSAPAKGSAVIIGNELRFDPNGVFENLLAGQTEPVTLQVTASDPDTNTSTPATITINVAGRNDPPVLAGGPLAATENGGVATLDLTLLGSDPDQGQDGSSLTYALVVPVTGASIVGTEFRYDPGNRFEALNQGETSTEDILIQATDPDGLASNQVTIAVTVTGENDTPTMADGALAATEDGSQVTLDLTTLGDDADASHGPGDLTYALVAPVAGASITGTTLQYDPGAGFQDLAQGQTDTLSLEITAEDPLGATSAAGTVTVTITGLNDDPTLAAGTLAATEDGGAVTLDLATLGADVDQGEDGSTLTYSLITPPAEASVTGNILTYDPGGGFQALNAGETTGVTLTVQAEDAEGATVQNNVVVTITGVNDAPAMIDGSATVGERDGSTAISLAALASDPDSLEDGSTLTYEVVSGPAKGSAVISGTDVLFDPLTDFDSLGTGDSETVTFTVRALDGANETSNTVTISVLVTGVDDAPLAPDFTVSHDGGASSLIIDALAQASDDEPGFFIASVGVPGVGAAIIDDKGTADPADDEILYSPALVTDGNPDSFTYTIEDIDGQQTTGTITVNVPANSPPVAGDDAAAITLVSRQNASFFADGGKHYDFIRGYYTWSEAQALAAAKGGHLATITSVDENAFAAALVAGGNSDQDAWLGATDGAVEGEWRWVEGVEGAEDGGQGRLFWLGDATGAAAGGSFTNWLAGQPDPGGASGLDHLVMQRFLGGVWDDVFSGDGRGYLLEYNGVPQIAGDLSINDTDSDAGDSLTYSLVGTVDGFVLETDGTYTFDSTDVAYASLADGAILEVFVDYLVTDERGAGDTGRLTLTLTGVNDAPTAADDTAQIDLAVGGGPPAGAGAVWGVNGHYYEYIAGPFIWSDARTDALARGGYIANVTSAAEQAHVAGVAAGRSAFLGGSDAAVEGEWRWIDGPEAGDLFWVGAAGGAAQGGAYVNWSGGQPDSGGEDFLHMFGNGTWNDIVDADIPAIGSAMGYIFEYSGVSPVTGSVAGNDTDPEGDALTFSLSGSYDGLSMASDGTWTFDPTDSAYTYLGGGETAFINAYYIADDGNGGTSDGRLQIELTGVNNAPTNANIDAGSVDETAAPVVIDLLSLASDPDTNDTLSVTDFSFSWTGDGTGPALSLAGDNTVTINPAALAALETGEAANLTITYNVTDGTETVAGQAILTVTGVTSAAPMPISAVNDVLFLPAVSVGIISPDGTSATAVTKTRDQLLDSTTYDFSVSTYTASDSIGWDAVLATHDVLVIGGTDAPSPSLDGQSVWGAVQSFSDNEGGVVSTGNYSIYIGNGPNAATGGTLADLVAVAPISPHSAPLYTTQAIDVFATAHPITDGVSDFTLTETNWIRSTPIYSNSVSLAGDLGDPAFASALAYNDLVGGHGNMAYVGGNYLGAVDSNDELRGEEPDQLLEQAVFWAADKADVVNTSEDLPYLVSIADLLQNDDDPSGLGLTLVNVPAYSALGAQLTISGGDIIYNPLTSTVLNDLGAAATSIDRFFYTIENSDGSETATGVARLLISGVDGVDAPPIIFSMNVDGFSSGQNNAYTVNPLLFTDDDAGTGIGYKFGEVSPDGALSDIFDYDPSTRTLTTVAANYSAADEGFYNFWLTAYEGDGDYTSVRFGAYTDASGDISFTALAPESTAFEDIILEMGLEAGIPLGDVGPGDATAIVSLSDVHTLAPSLLAETKDIDISNGQENTLTLDTDDLLNLISGNAIGANEVIEISADTFDHITFASNSDWSVGVSGSTYEVNATPDGLFAAFGNFVTFQIDEGNVTT